MGIVVVMTGGVGGVGGVEVCTVEKNIFLRLCFENSKRFSNKRSFCVLDDELLDESESGVLIFFEK